MVWSRRRDLRSARAPAAAAAGRRSGPTGRMILVSRACSSTLADQPITRATANVGVNISRGRPHSVHHDPGVELDVGVQLAAGLELGEDLDDPRARPARPARPARRAVAAEPLGDLAQQPRARVLGAVDGVAEAHDPVAGQRPARRTQRVDPVRRCRSRPAGPAPGSARRRAAARTARRCAPTRQARDVGAGRGDHPGGERRGVEAVVDGRASGTARRPGPCSAVGSLAGEHREVVRGVAEVGRAGSSGSRPWPQPVQRGQHASAPRRRARARPARRSRRCQVVDRRAARGRCRAATARCAARPAADPPAAAMAGQRRGAPRRAGAAAAATSRGERRRARRRRAAGRRTSRNQTSSRPRRSRQLDRRVLAVVVEALAGRGRRRARSR